jgi:multidrug transporter EmrE-like cation transporter
MERLNLPSLTLAGVCVIMIIAGQTLLKLAVTKSGGISVLELGPIGLLQKFFSVPYIFVGFGLYAISGILWLQVLSKLDFSVAFPLASSTYVGTLLVGRLLFNEPVNFYRVLGVVLICSGVVFVIRSQ